MKVPGRKGAVSFPEEHGLVQHSVRKALQSQNADLRLSASANLQLSELGPFHDNSDAKGRHCKEHYWSRLGQGGY